MVQITADSSINSTPVQRQVQDEEDQKKKKKVQDEEKNEETRTERRAGRKHGPFMLPVSYALVRVSYSYIYDPVVVVVVVKKAVLNVMTHHVMLRMYILNY